MRVLALVVILGWVTVPARAQGLAHVWQGPQVDDGFGHAVARAGDLDGDGYEDVVVGAPWFRFPRGYVQVLSGRTGTTLFRFEGSRLRTMTGFSVDGGGDVNKDGVPDFVYGSVGVGGFSFGYVVVRSGVDGTQLHGINGMSVGFQPGFDVAIVGDVNGDGHADFVASDPVIDSAYLFSGATGGVLYKMKSKAGVNDELGWCVDGADVAGGSGAEIIVGAPGSYFGSYPGCVEVYTGKSGTLLYRITGYQVGSRFGEALAIAGDVNADGTLDLVVGAPGHAGQQGRAYVFSLEDSTPLILTLAGGGGAGRFGASVDGVGDVNGDGFDDVLVGAPFDDGLAPDGGRVTVFSGADGSVLWTTLGAAAGGRLGESVAAIAAGPLGRVVAGAPHRDWPTSSAAPGYARLHSLEAPAGVYCTAKVNSEGCVPHAAVTGVASLSASTLNVNAGQVINQQPGFLFWGPAPKASPFMGGLQCVQSIERRRALATGGNPPPYDCSGTLNDDWSSAYLVAQGLGAGQTVYAQFWYLDPSASQGVGLTDAVQFTVQP